MNPSEIRHASVGILLRSLEELFHPVLLTGLLNHAGQRLGKETSARYRASRKKRKPDSFTSGDYVRAMTADGIWSAGPIEVAPTLVRFAIDQLPAVNQTRLLAPLVSGFFGAAAADLFGAAQVVVLADLEGEGLMVTIRLGKSSLSWKDGDSYTKEGPKRPKPNRLTT